MGTKNNEAKKSSKNDMSYIRDYTEKIKSKLLYSDYTAEELNFIIVFLNYCFYTKNDFFIENYNRTQIRLVKKFYNILKTNMLTQSRLNILEDIDDFLTKPIKFIIGNVSSIYDTPKFKESGLNNLLTAQEIKDLFLKM